ncbi:CobD/CbiB family protein [Ottowia sp.]|uniref:CobD/CbiB family protein n=1 Tax=Ottowia sp. TaxID=1898956 RepID=UPI002B7A0E96|nr:CobD/CbiB family protein [Ottowia sp.]HOB67766.1 CobD/CbiB family protein [Ottowia sp.]HPZ56141.1 CobD/CbiB family protein [Ottowia sp.]HQD46721.1 CobD/CbiB family protein [Ottowia sp.]
MAFFAIAIALLLEQVRPLAANHPAAVGLRRWLSVVGRNVDAGAPQHGWLAWMLAVGVPTLCVAAVNAFLGWLGGWPLVLVWNVGMLYLTLGFRQFSHHFTGIRDALEAGDEDRARTLLAQWQQVDASAVPRSEIVRHVIEYSVLAAHRHVFGVLVWFCIGAVLGLGPAGAVFYRNAEYGARYWRRHSESAEHPTSPALRAAADTAWHLIDWLPSRATALGFAIVGSFEEAIDVWRNHALRFADANDGVILAATAGAIGVRLGGASLRPLSADASAQPAPAQGAASADGLPGATARTAHFGQVVGLVWRTVALWLLLLVLLTLAHVLG